MAGGGSTSTNSPKPRKRVEADTPSSSSSATLSLKRAKDGSAFIRCEECNHSVPVALIDMHNCSLEAKIKMSLDAQVVERPAEVKKKAAPRKKSASSGGATTESSSKKRKLTKVQDPNKPKRPQTAYFLFMDDFRKAYKEEHPNAKGGKEVAREGGEKWRNMTDEEKQHYLDHAKELKEAYEKEMEAYKAENVEDSGDFQAEELCDEDA